MLLLHYLDDQTIKHKRWNRMQKKKQQKELSTAWERDRQIRSYLRSREEARRRGQTPAVQPPPMLRSLGIGQKKGKREKGREDEARAHSHLEKSASTASFAASVTSDVDIGIGYDMRG